MSLKKLAAGVALTTLASLAATGAYAQSTASQVSEVVVTTNKVATTGGLAVQTQVAKNQSIVTSQFIDTQVGSVNAAQLINFLPGVSYSTSDPTGVLSDDFRFHGFDGNHVSWTIDGSPVNDTGNYASFPGEYLTTEVTDRVTVNIGQTEVDSPSASAIGGTVNIVTKTPAPIFGGNVSGAFGSYGSIRGYGEIDTGEFGPWGTKAFFSFNSSTSNKYQGGGTLKKEGIDFRVYQPLKGNDFVSIAGTYNSNRAYFYDSSSLAQYAQFGRYSGIDYNTQWGIPTVTPGKADAVGGPTTAAAPGFMQGGDAGQGFWAYHENPVDFADIRVQSRFDLSHGFTLTADPYFFYTLANGGGSTSLRESDLRLAGASGKPACVDLNGDGDCLDTVLVASPTVAVLPLMSRSAGYKNEDLVAVAGLSNAPWFFAVPKGIPANTMTEFIAYAKANQGKLNIGIIGIGSSSHLLTQRFKVATGVDMTEVPYNGSALVMKDLMGGTVQAVIDGAATSLAAFKSGQATLLATTSDKRQPNAPDVPTFRELGYPKIVATAWFGMFAPSKTPTSIRQRLGAEAIKALTDQAVKDRLIATGGVPWAGTTEEFIAFLAQDFPNWEEDAKRSGLKTD